VCVCVCVYLRDGFKHHLTSTVHTFTCKRYAVSHIWRYSPKKTSTRTFIDKATSRRIFYSSFNWCTARRKTYFVSSHSWHSHKVISLFFLIFIGITTSPTHYLNDVTSLHRG